MKIPSITPTLGSMPGIKAFTAAVIGGIGSIPGAMIGGILLGVIEEVCNSIPAVSSYTTAIEFGILVLILLVILSVQSQGLKEKLKVYAAQQEELQQKIDSETARTDEIKKLEEYKNTTEYVEEIAKDKLGLVYKDEIIFKPSN